MIIKFEWEESGSGINLSLPFSNLLTKTSITTMDRLFYLCVELLVWLAELTSTTYEEINVIVFIIVGPIIFSLLVMYSIFITYRYGRLKREV